MLLISAAEIYIRILQISKDIGGERNSLQMKMKDIDDCSQIIVNSLIIIIH